MRRSFADAADMWSFAAMIARLRAAWTGPAIWRRIARGCGQLGRLLTSSIRSSPSLGARRSDCRRCVFGFHRLMSARDIAEFGSISLRHDSGSRFRAPHPTPAEEGPFGVFRKSPAHSGQHIVLGALIARRSLWVINIVTLRKLRSNCRCGGRFKAEPPFVTPRPTVRDNGCAIFLLVS